MNHKALVVLDLFFFGPNHASNTPDTVMGSQLCGEADLAESSLGQPVTAAAAAAVILLGATVVVIVVILVEWQ